MFQILKILSILILFAPFILSGTPIPLNQPQEGSINIDNNYDLELDKTAVTRILYIVNIYERRLSQHIGT